MFIMKSTRNKMHFQDFLWENTYYKVDKKNIWLILDQIRKQSFCDLLTVIWHAFALVQAAIG